MYVRTADFGVDYADIRRIRLEVFVDEQRVPEELELDDRDAACTHVLAIDDAGAAVGYTPLGAVFLEAGIEHVEMRRRA